MIEIDAVEFHSVFFEFLIKFGSAFVGLALLGFALIYFYKSQKRIQDIRQRGSDD